MGNWLTAAAKAFQRPTPQPQTFELRCGCGRAVGGVRTITYQQIPCPACQRRLFVLPVSVYPVPKSRPASKPKPIPRDEESLIDAELSDEPSADVGSEPDTARSPDTRKRRGAPAEERQKRSKPAGVPPAKTPPQPEAIRIPRKPLITPLRGLFAGIAALVVFTGWWIVHSRAVQLADMEYQIAARRAREALSRQDLTAADEALTTAHNALGITGRSDGPARATQQLYREVHAAVTLVEKSPGDLLAEATSPRASSLEEGWQQVFQYSYRGSWVILDAEVSRIEGTKRRYRVDYPISAGKDRAEIVAELPIFEKPVDLSKPRRVIFAAQIEEFRHNTHDVGLWELVLKPDSAFLWSNLQTLQLVGLAGEPSDAETRSTLAEQTSLLGLPAAPDAPTTPIAAIARRSWAASGVLAVGLSAGTR